MPRVQWDFDVDAVFDEFDRESNFKTYTGQVPPLGAVYIFALKTFKYAAPTEEKGPQFRAGLELVPRGASEQKYAGYFIMAFLNISKNADWTWVPFFDRLGVSGRAIKTGTIVDEDGKVKSIGKWHFKPGDELIFAKLEKGIWKGEEVVNVRILEDIPTDDHFDDGGDEEELDDGDDYEDDGDFDGEEPW